VLVVLQFESFKNIPTRFTTGFTMPPRPRSKAATARSDDSADHQSEGDTRAQVDDLLATALHRGTESPTAIRTPITTQDPPPETLREKIERLRNEHELLREGAELCRDMYGDDLSQYPDDVRQFLTNAGELRGRSIRRVSSTHESLRHQSPAETITPYSERGSPSPRLPATIPREALPSKYEGKSTYELEEFLQQCEAIFTFSPGALPTDEKRIQWAAMFFKGKPRQQWTRHCQAGGHEGLGWEGFKNFLTDLHLDPANRRRLAVKRFNAAKQRPGQKIRAFAHYLEELERDIEPFTERGRANFLFAKLSAENEQRLIRGGYKPESMTVEEIIATVAMLEQALDQDQGHVVEGKGLRLEPRRNEPSGPLRPVRARQPARRPYNPKRLHPETNGASGPFAGSTQPAKKPFTPDSSICYNCNKKRHFARDCCDKAREARI
jgi:hypothetical protein